MQITEKAWLIEPKWFNAWTFRGGKGNSTQKFRHDSDQFSLAISSTFFLVFFQAWLMCLVSKL